MTTKKKIYIVAGSFTEFSEYKEKKLLEWTEYSNILDYFPEYVYVANVWQLKGLNEIEGYYIGSYKNRIDLDEITWCIKAIKARNAITDVQKGSNGISGTSITSIIGDSVNTPLVGTMLPIGSVGTGTISNINTVATTQYSYPNPNLEQRTKVLEESLKELKNDVEVLQRILYSYVDNH